MCEQSSVNIGTNQTEIGIWVEKTTTFNSVVELES